MSDFRKYIIPRKEGNVFIEFDFKQLEVNALAEISKCKRLIHELNSGLDVHRSNAASWKKIPEDQVEPDVRTLAKVMTFQMQYGASPKSMAKSLGIPQQEVVDFKKAFFDKYPEVAQLHALVEQTVQSANASKKDIGNVEIPIDTITGRKYMLTPHKDEDRGVVYYSKTEGKNYPIQGFGTGDIVPLVTNKIFQLMESCEKYLCTTVHDSDLFDIPEDLVYTLLYSIEMAFLELPKYFKEMFDYDLQVHYDYDISIGGNWKELKQEENQYSRAEAIQILQGENYIGEGYECYRYYR